MSEPTPFEERFSQLIRLLQRPIRVDVGTNQELTRFDCDVAITVALKEELDAIQPLLPPTQRHQIAGSEHIEYYYKIPLPNQRDLNMMIALVNDMGDLDAGLVTMNYIVRTTTLPKLVVSLGIAGSMDKKLLLNDVIVASGIDRYMSKSKAVPSKWDTGPFDLQHGGHVLPVCNRCAGFATDFNTSKKAAFEDWQLEGGTDNEIAIAPETTAKLKEHKFIGEFPKLMVGIVACGPAVSAAEGFTAWIKDRERSTQAIDMESGGVVQAWKRSPPERRPPHVIVIRGISDFADDRKEELETMTADGVRAVAMRNAYRMLLKLLQNGLLPNLV